MSNETFKPGDTVTLKSGGPVMTVQTADYQDAVICVWFDGLRQANSTFSAAVLEPYKKPRPSVSLI